MNKQREAVYGLRRQLMEGVDQKQLITEDYTGTILSNILDEFAPEKTPVDDWKTEKIFEALFDIFGARFSASEEPAEKALSSGSEADSSPEAALLSSSTEAGLSSFAASQRSASAPAQPAGFPLDLHTLTRHELGETIYAHLQSRYAVKEQILGSDAMRYHERIVMLSVLDGLWKDHLLAMDHLKEGIGLRSYAQQDPLVAYKKESFDMFEAMMLRFQEDTARHLFRMQIIGPDGTSIETPEQLAQAQAMQQQVMMMQQQAALQGQSSHQPQSTPQQPAQLPPTTRKPEAVPVAQQRAPSTTIDRLEREFQQKKERKLELSRQAGASASAEPAGQRTTGAKLGRNDKCPCGSGKKYKQCHGAAA
jgi:preprotein translocase subunit SecA